MLRRTKRSKSGGSTSRCDFARSAAVTPDSCAWVAVTGASGSADGLAGGSTGGFRDPVLLQCHNQAVPVDNPTGAEICATGAGWHGVRRGSAGRSRPETGAPLPRSNVPAYGCCIRCIWLAMLYGFSRSGKVAMAEQHSGINLTCLHSNLMLSHCSSAVPLLSGVLGTVHPREPVDVQCSHGLPRCAFCRG